MYLCIFITSRDFFICITEVKNTITTFLVKSFRSSEMCPECLHKFRINTLLIVLIIILSL